MGVSNTLMVVVRVPAFEVKGHYAGLVTIVEDEREWRAPPSGPALAPRVVVTRWRSLDPRTREVSAETRSTESRALLRVRSCLCPARAWQASQRSMAPTARRSSAVRSFTVATPLVARGQAAGDDAHL
jgi:hypothetical protein